MRILIDESLPVELASELSGFEAITVRKQRWLHLRNGVLLRAAADAGFSALVTADQSIPNQQNLSGIGIGVVVMSGVRNRIEDLRPLIPQMMAALAIIKPGESMEIAPRRRDSVRDAELIRAFHSTSRSSASSPSV